MTSLSFQTCLQTLWWKTITQHKKKPHKYNLLPLKPSQVHPWLCLSCFLVLFCQNKWWWFLTPFTLKSDAQPTASCHSVPVPYTTRYYWKRKLVKEKDGIYTRKYVRRSDAIQCRKCNKERIKSTHRQYYGNWYCQETETKPFAMWKAELLKRGYGRKKFWRVDSPMHIQLQCSFHFNFI